MTNSDIRYLERLSDLYPTIAAASTEVINLEAILNLPKGTEHFLTDIHGEYEAFSHVLKNPPFTEERVSNFVSYGENLFSCDIYFIKHMDDLQDRNEGEIEDVMNSTFYFMKYDATKDGIDNPRWVILDIREILSE